MIKITQTLDENSSITDVINPTDFPDGTKLIRFCPGDSNSITITWLYDNDGELFQLIALTQHLKAKGIEVNLDMPYVPNARMDRVKENGEVFTLKYFANVINWLGFHSVKICNPHSTVSEALFDRVIVDFDCVREDVVNILFLEINGVTRFNADVLFFPDAGSLKRYGDLFKHLDIPFAYGEKNRDWKTGKILGLNVISNGIDLNGKKVLIVDDISSKRGTFLHSANALKKLGANEVALYVTHCENTILDGELVKDTSPIDRIYTTNSIFRGKNVKIEIIRKF